MVFGRIHSIESMGLVDGPGIRVVVFFQGCSLRCKFCHNPDSWDMSQGQQMSSADIMAKIVRFRPYFERSGGGVTFSGGEPLLQKEFLVELLRECKKQNIHTCLDTAGVGSGDYDEILSLTDLVLYDVKAITESKYEEICGRKMDQTTKFQKALEKSGTPTIVRQVIIPGVNDSDEYMISLKNYIKTNIPTAFKVELLPFHKMGAHKYKKLNIVDPYSSIDAMDAEKTNNLWQKHFKDMKEEIL
ncbi:MAG: pyruvate formate lyase-activating protein [Clostridia bacterium]|nr:pyruvate formate lyase-activating protein [Clostridia bacterium]